MTPTAAAMRRRSRRERWVAFVAGAATGLTPLVGVPVAQAAQRPVVHWSDTTVRAGTKIEATVMRGSLPKRTSPVVQRRFPDGWRAVDRTVIRTGDGQRLSVPTRQYGRFTYRVVARSRAGVVRVSESRRVRVRPAYHPRGRERQYRFLDPSRRARWDSCRAVTWTFNGDRAPRRGLRQVKAAVRRLHAATGIEFDYVGRSDRKATPYGDGVPGARVIIGWRGARAFREYVGSPQVVGLAGQRFVSGYRDAGGRVDRTTQAGVILNAGHRLGSGFGRGATWGEVIVHELGHVMGLGHAPARKQVMYSSTTGYNAKLGAGDLNGLRQLGDTRGCLHRYSARAMPGSSLTR